MKKIKSLLLLSLTGIILIISSCDRDKAEIQKDAKAIGDAMCKNITIMNELRKANPMDSLAMDTLQTKAKNMRIEMTILYNEFNQKWGEKTKDEKFNKKFAKELRKAMLDCPNLSKEDREQFEKEVE